MVAVMLGAPSAGLGDLIGLSFCVVVVALLGALLNAKDSRRRLGVVLVALTLSAQSLPHVPESDVVILCPREWKWLGICAVPTPTPLEVR